MSCSMDSELPSQPGIFGYDVVTTRGTILEGKIISSLPKWPLQLG